ncbi:right-handed parallel beta-helix repeat-containing protein, partial [Synechococcus sp. H60.2]
PTQTSPPLQITLTWKTIDDLNLFVTDPTQQTVFFLKPSIPSGGTLEADANRECVEVTTSPVENVFWASAPPTGSYVVAVELFKRCSKGTDPIPFTVTVRKSGSAAQTFSGAATSPGSAGRFTFSFP